MGDEVFQPSQEALQRFLAVPSDEVLNKGYRKRADHIAQTVREFLEDSEDLFMFVEGGLDAIISRKIDAELSDYPKRRIQGEFNDEENIMPGVIIYLTRGGFEEVQERREHYSQWISDDQIQQVAPDIYEIILPKGFYGINTWWDQSQMLFSNEKLNPEYFQPGRGGGDWEPAVPIDMVIRAVGIGGGCELWQNPELTKIYIPVSPPEPELST